MKYITNFDGYLTESLLPNQQKFFDKLRQDKPVLIFQYTTDVEKTNLLDCMNKFGFKSKLQEVDILVMRADKNIFSVGEDPKNIVVLYKSGTKIGEYFGMYENREMEIAWDRLVENVKFKINTSSYKTYSDNLTDTQLFMKLRGNKPVLVFQYNNDEEKINLLEAIRSIRLGQKLPLLEIILHKTSDKFRVGEFPHERCLLYSDGNKLAEFNNIYTFRREKEMWNNVKLIVDKKISDGTKDFIYINFFRNPNDGTIGHFIRMNPK